jgi:hypothetical protein
VNVSPEILTLILRIVQILLIPVLAWIFKEIFALRREIAALRVNVCRNEDRLEHLPDTNSLHQLALGVEGLRGDMRAVSARIGGLEQVVDKLDAILERQENYLLTGGGQSK